MRSDYEDLVSVYLDACSQYSDRPLFGTKEPAAWRWTSYGEFLAIVDAFRSGLAALGVEPGDRVAIVSRNSIEWAVACYATYGLEAAFVPMYEAQLPSEMEFILADSGAKVVIASTQALFEALRDIRKKIPALAHVVGVELPDPDPSSYLALASRGRRAPVAPRRPSADHVAGLVYTSGTTGKPKGVLLTHRNLSSNLNAIRQAFPIGPDERTLSFLPWAHAFGQTCELHYVLSSGASTAINDDVRNLPRNLAEVKPTVLIAVPRIFNAMYETVNARVNASPRFVRKLFRDGINAAVRLHRDEPVGPLRKLEKIVDDRTIFAKVRERLGGRLKFVVSGSATLNPTVLEFMDAIGIPVYDGYGLSEASPAVSTNRPGRKKLGTVGQPLPGVRVEIDRSVTSDEVVGEIVVFGPNVMLGYHNRAEETARALTADGGLRTGDLGYLDEEGYLHVVGRIKEQYKLDSGKYVMPGPIEEQLSLSPYIANVMLYGENRPYNVAVVVPKREALSKWAAEQAIDVPPDLPPRLVLELLRAELSEYGRGLRSHELPKRFVVAKEEFGPENGLLTPTLKIRRQKVLELYRAELDALYRDVEADSVEHGAPRVEAER